MPDNSLVYHLTFAKPNDRKITTVRTTLTDAEKSTLEEKIILAIKKRQVINYNLDVEQDPVSLEEVEKLLP